MYHFYTIVKLKNHKLSHPKLGTSCSSTELWWLMADSQANPQCTAFVQETWVAWQPHPWAHEGGDWGKEDVEEIMRMRVCVCVCVCVCMCDRGGRRRTRSGTSHLANNSCNSLRQCFSNHLWWRTRYLNFQFIRDWCFCKSNCMCVYVYISLRCNSYTIKFTLLQYTI